MVVLAFVATFVADSAQADSKVPCLILEICHGLMALTILYFLGQADNR